MSHFILGCFFFFTEGVGTNARCGCELSHAYFWNGIILRSSAIGVLEIKVFPEAGVISLPLGDWPGRGRLPELPRRQGQWKMTLQVQGT